MEENTVVQEELRVLSKANLSKPGGHFIGGAISRSVKYNAREDLIYPWCSPSMQN